MKANLYLSLIPEALVFSMLSPEEFGRYLALGAERRTHGQALFLAVDGAGLQGAFDLEEARARCKPHPDGRPHRSSYVSIYRVLERIPITALGSLYLVTRDGTTLELEKTVTAPPASEQGFHLYQEFCPITPLVVSRLGPAEFGRYITQPGQPVSLPRLIFAELDLGPLAAEPRSAAPALPYRGLAQVRYSLQELQARPDKVSKIVERKMQGDLPFWMIRDGIYVGDQSAPAFYPMPAEEVLRKQDFEWWSSARAVEVL